LISRSPFSRSYRLIAWGLSISLVSSGLPVTALAAPAPVAPRTNWPAPAFEVSQGLLGERRLAAVEPQGQDGPANTPKKPDGPTSTLGRRLLPKVSPAPTKPVFSDAPTADEIFRVRLFEEPLAPTHEPSAADNKDIVTALETYLAADLREDTTALDAYLVARKDSPWRLALLTNLAILARKTGYYSRAIELSRAAWESGRGEEAVNSRALANRALVELVEMYARIGEMEKLSALFEETKERSIGGSMGARLETGRAALAVMRTTPHLAFRCGPLAVASVLETVRPEAMFDEALPDAQSTIEGTSLSQISRLAGTLGLGMRMAFRPKETVQGAADEPKFPTPSVVHWRAGHFAALVRVSGDRYLVKDPTFGSETWVSERAIETETTGFFLVKGVPNGWREVSPGEGGTVFGKGAPSHNDPNAYAPEDADDQECSPGMAKHRFFPLHGAIGLMDLPVSYSPPIGPAVQFKLSYAQTEISQPTIFSYSNVGPMWTNDWLSYLTDDPSAAGAQSLMVYRRGGGREPHTLSGGVSAGHFRTQAQIVRAPLPDAPVRYERRLPDGSVEVFAQPDGSVASPRKVFMTESRDPQGNKLSFIYDSQLRLVAVVDAIGQVTTLSYDLSQDPLKITKVTDPFGRSAALQYDASGRLESITDVVGLTSSFTYGSADFISSLTTPYGTTRFEWAASGANRWIQATDPLGGVERYHYQNDHSTLIAEFDPAGTQPPGWHPVPLPKALTFHWSKRLMALAPLDYNKAEQIHWTYINHVVAGVPRMRKRPLENRVWYKYQGQGADWQIGSVSQPSVVTRRVVPVSAPGGAVDQTWTYEYNSQGMPLRAVDPLGRETRYTYGNGTTPDLVPLSGTGIDLLKVEQKNGATWEVLASYKYNEAARVPPGFQGRVMTEATDASGQVTVYTYNSKAQLLTVTTPARAGITENRTTTMTYDANGYLIGTLGPAPGDTASYTYDAQGRMRTTTDSDGHTLTFEYDAMDRPTKTIHPDGTTDQTEYEKLHVSRTKDRRGRWTSMVVDALQRTVAVRDPLARTVTFDWCACGSLNALIDGKGQRTSWEYDLQGRTTKMIRPDGSSSRYVYEEMSGRLKEAFDPRNQKATVTYFNDNRWKKIEYGELAAGVVATPSVNFTYDLIYPRLSTIIDGTGTTTYGYHPIPAIPGLGAGRLATVDGPLTSDVISYGYDELGRVKQRQIYGAASTTTTAYDVLGRVSGETNVLGAFTYGYDGVTGRLLTMGYPNGNQSTFDYFTNADDHRLKTIHHKKTGAVTISRYDYTYDKEGVIQTWQLQRDAAAPQVFNLGHDLADQLVEATLQSTDPTPVVAKRFRYAYDKAENRTAEQVDGAVTQASHNVLNQLTTSTPGGAIHFGGTTNETANVTVGVVGQAPVPARTTATNEFNALVSVPPGTTNVEVKATDPSGNLRTNTYSVSQSGATNTFTYDGNGNMLSDGTRTYEWDAINQLVAINQGVNRSEFTYDGWGKRVRMVEKVSGATTSDRRFLWCGLEICEERDSAGSTVVKRFFAQGVQDNGTALFYATDHLGSVRELTDSTGTVRARYDYDPYGRTTRVSGDKDSDYTYAGLFAHQASGLHLAVFRAYDSGLGRWINEDPSGHDDGINMLRYVSGAPISWSDPLGLGPWRNVPGHPGWKFHHDPSAGGGDPVHTQYQKDGERYARRVSADKKDQWRHPDKKKVDRDVVDKDVPQEVIDDTPPHPQAPKEPSPADKVPVPAKPASQSGDAKEMACEGCADPRLVTVVQAGAAATAAVITLKVIAACACVAAGGVLLGWTCFILAP